MESVLDFFFWTVWSSDSAGRRNVREHAEPLGVRHRVARAFRRLRSLPQANGSKENERGRRIGAPLRFPAPPHQAWRGTFRCRNRPEAKRRVRYPRRPGAGPGGLRRLQGPAGFAKGRCPLASAHNRMSNTGFSRPPSILLFPCGFCGLPAVRPADLSCRLGDGSRSVPVRP